MKTPTILDSIKNFFSTAIRMHDESERFFLKSIEHLDDRSKATLLMLRRAPR